jgi:hypothetical protein
VTGDEPFSGRGADVSEEELRAQLEEQMKKITVQDVLLQTVVTLVNLAGRRLTVEDEKDVEQAKVAIEAVRALLPLCPEDQVAPVKDALSQLQMVYVRETQEPRERPAPSEAPGAAADDPERERARSKIWTPPGSS